MSKIKYFILPILSFIFSCFLCYDSHAINSFDTFATLTMNETTEEMFAQNNILFYDPCVRSSGSMDGSFKVDPTVNPWYAEGDVIRTYLGGITNTDLINWTDPSKAPSGNQEIYKSTQDDDSMGGMQYVYAGQYDITWNGSSPTFVKNGSNDITKYYWVVLPDGLYGNAVGELFLATFENIQEPVHLIVLDTHSCEHTDICKQAMADPDNFVGGEGLLGAFTNQGGNPTTLHEFTGGLTGLHRLKGDSEQIVHETESGSASTHSKTCGADQFTFYTQPDGSSCGPTSFAMVATSSFGKNVTPQDAINKFTELGVYDSGAGTYNDAFRQVAPAYNISEPEQITASDTPGTIDTITQKLNDGFVFIVGCGGSDGSRLIGGVEVHENPCPKGGHFFVIRGIKDNKWLLANPAPNFGGSGENEEWEPNDIAPKLQKDNIWAFKGNGNCQDNCPGEGGELKSGGFKTLEEAKNFMKNYRDRASLKERGTINFENAIVSLDLCQDGTLNNCSSFSQWFINRYTSVGPDGCPTSGMNGDEVVNTLLGANLGFEDGGNTPRAWAIMSKTPQHTGVVLGVDTDNDKIFIGEANCDGFDAGWTWPDAHEYSLSSYSASNFKYAYTDKILKDIGD